MNRISKALSAVIVLAALIISNAARGDIFDSVPGTVINYIQSPVRLFGYPISPVYISDPSIVVLPNGDYIASHARFGSGSNSTDSGETSVFRSSDKGQSWTFLVTLNGILRGSLFVHNNDLYILGAEAEGKPAVIRKSTDSGTTWTEPVSSTTGLLSIFGPGTPNNPVVFNNRIWSGATRRLYSAAVTSDLLKASSWSMTNEPSNEGHPFGDLWQGWTEGQAVASPFTGAYILPKIRALPHTALIRATSPTSISFYAASLNAFPSLPGGEKKFGASYDSVSGRFYILSNPVLDVHAGGSTPPELVRTAAAILSSRDLIYWDVEKIFLFTENLDNGSFGEGFQYFNFDIDGEDMAVASRTAFDVGGGQRKPPRGHDSNLLTFHRIEDFRNAAPEHILVIDSASGQVLRFEITQHQSAPLGRFTLGEIFDGYALTAPNGIVQDENGYVYIGEQNGRILKFDALGNFIETVEESPIPLQDGSIAVNQPARGERAWRNNGSGNWYDLTNWYYWGRADTDYEVANLGSAIHSDVNITVDRLYTMKGIRFQSENSYLISGSGEIALQSGTGEAILAALRGNHDISIPVKLLNDAIADTQDSASLNFSGSLNLNGRDIFITGYGQIHIDCTFRMNGGSVVTDGLSPVVFGQNVIDTLDGSLVFEPDASLDLSTWTTYKLLEGTQYLTKEFSFVQLPVLPERLMWDESLLYSQGLISVVPDYSTLDLLNFGHIALWWLTSDCHDQPGCYYADLNNDNYVDFYDIPILGEYWLEQ
jgi:hypothetical protein